MTTFSAMWSTRLGQAIRFRAIKQTPDGYPIEMHAGGADLAALTDAVNQGIDSHLEGVRFAEFEGEHGRRGFRFDAETLPVLIRRLMESGNDEAHLLASAICQTLEIELI